MLVNDFSSVNSSPYIAQNNENFTVQNSIETQHKNSVLSKNEAVYEVLGYGVDSEGFFTNDFNAKAQISSDYRIYAKDIENFVSYHQNRKDILATHNTVDIAKSVANAYKVLSQLSPYNTHTSFSKEELENMPYAFKMDKNYNVIKSYSYEEYQKAFDKDEGGMLLTFNTLTSQGFNEINANTIFNRNISKANYQNADGSVDKGGVLMAFLNNSSILFNINHFLEGETTLLGKVIGLDKTITQREIDEFKAFMNANKIKSAFDSSSSEWNFIEDKFSLSFYVKDSVENKLGDELVTMARQLQEEYDELVSSNLSLDELKQKYLDFKARHDDFIKQFDEAMSEVALNEMQNNDINFSNFNTKTKENSNNSSNQISKRTPIEVISKSQTYKDLNFSSIQSLLKDKHKIQMFELLFSQKNDKTNHSSKDFMNFNVKQFNQMKNLNSLDIKA